MRRLIAAFLTALPMASLRAQGADPFPHVVSIEIGARTVRVGSQSTT